MLMMFRTLATVINCPQKVLEINFTESKKIVSLSLFAPLPTIYGQSCDGLNLTMGQLHLSEIGVRRYAPVTA